MAAKMNSVRAGDFVYYQPYTFSYWQAAVVVLAEIPVDSKKTIDARAVFAHISGPLGGWEKHYGPAHLHRSDIRAIYREDRQLDADTLNSDDLWPTLWQAIEPETATFVPGRVDVRDPIVLRTQRIAHLLKEKHPAHASIMHDFGDPGRSQCTICFAHHARVMIPYL
jgi:hypothetical protein